MNIIVRIKRWYYRRKVQQVINMIKTIDVVMIKGGYTRTERRRFRRGIVKDSTEVLGVLSDAIASVTGPSGGGGV